MVQTRDNEGELRQFDTLAEAFDYASENLSVWKISFSFGTERVRLVKVQTMGWLYEDIFGNRRLQSKLSHEGFTEIVIEDNDE